MTTENPYAAPVAVAHDSDTSSQHYYVVASRKFLVMMVGTMALYSLYWFYRQWAGLKQRFKSDIWPIPRAIFNVFFTHSLFAQVDNDMRAQGHKINWMPGAMATLYVVCAIATRVFDRLGAKQEALHWFDFASFPLLVPIVWSLWTAQQAINLAENDPAGQSNAHFTAANIVWLVLGGLVWLLSLIGLYALLVGIPGV